MTSKKMKKQPQKDVSNQENTKANPEQEAVSEDLKNLRKLINDLENNHVVQTKELEAQKMTQCISEKPDIELVKNDNKQYVFEINYKDESTNETYFVQILKSKAKLELGKLKMPSGLDFERILSETPLTDNQGITRFIRNCQRYISFYHKRKKKFHQCQSYLHDAVNCHIDTNHNYSTLYLQLLKVFDASVDGFYNVTIYLFFDLASSEATEMKVETSADKDHKNAALQHLEFCLEIFSDGEIEDALKVFEEDEKTGPISWKLEFADGDLEYSSSSTSHSDESQSEDNEKAAPEVSKKRVIRKKKNKESKEMISTMPKKRITKGKRKSLTIEKGTGLASKSKLKQTKLNFSTKKNPQGMDDQIAKATPATTEDNTQGNDTNVIQNDNMNEQENIEPPKTKNPEKGKRRKFFVTSTPSISGPPRKKKAKK